MKRASLVAVPVAKKAATPDLTDRILARTPGARARPPAPRPRAKVTARASLPAPRPKSPPQSQSVPAPTPPDPVRPPLSGSASWREALTQSQSAVEALVSAARSAPARYDLALRYRLDALAHHLKQVTEFLASVEEK